MEPYFADGCPLIEMEKGDRPGKKERENTKKSRGAEKKKQCFRGPLYCMQLHQQLNAGISRRGEAELL